MSNPLFRPDSGLTDRGRRAADLLNLHRELGSAGRWAAIRLSDGGSDGHVYDSREEAIRFQLHEQWCAYFLIPHDHVTASDAERFLTINGNLYDAGMRLTEPGAPMFQIPKVERLY